LASRDPGALETLVDRHHATVYRFLRHLTRSVEDAEDLAQATILRAVAGAHRYDGRAPMRTWLLAIAFREFGRFRRRRLWLPLIGDRPAADEFGRIHDGEALLAALSRLPEASRAVVLLHHVEELPIGEIAITLGIPEGTVKSRLFSARGRLRTLLGEEVPYVTETCKP
jgi:RNA polymerase sigma-70 factor, ECF subfamily